MKARLQAGIWRGGVIDYWQVCLEKMLFWEALSDLTYGL